MGQVQGFRTAEGDIQLIKDVGEYDVWSSVVAMNGQSAPLIFFSYGFGGNIPGAPNNARATRLETNMYVPNQFVDESMNVYAIALTISRLTPGPLLDTTVPPTPDYTAIYPDFIDIEAKTLFGFFVGGEKPFAEGRVTWFAEAGGFYGFTTGTNTDIIANNVPTPASARVWKYTLPISRVMKFWGQLDFLRGPLVLGTGTEPPVVPGIEIVCRLLGVRTRGVQ